MSTHVPFARMNGIGNAILVVDMRGRADRVTPAAAIALDGDPATKFDQIMAIHDPRTPGTQNYIEILNSDGTFAQACGNGTRCVVAALAAETGQKVFTFETIAGILNAQEHENGLISVDLGKPRLDWKDIPLAEEFSDTRKIELQVGPIDAPVLHSPSVASMGNPHAIFWVDQDVWSYELDKFGPLLENHPIFPERANITIAHVTSRNSMTIRTWERGAGLTLACGSAACAAAVSGTRTNRTDRIVEITAPSGGKLQIEWRADDHVIMTGPTEWEFSGTLDPVTGAWQREVEGVA
jgi:diaminopimelate epimerase